jgi:hypothetical protein
MQMLRLTTPPSFRSQPKRPLFQPDGLAGAGRFASGIQDLYHDCIVLEGVQSTMIPALATVQELALPSACIVAIESGILAE